MIAEFAGFILAILVLRVVVLTVVQLYSDLREERERREWERERG